MIAMDPVMARGFTWWDRALLPRDEFEERARTVQQAMVKAGLDALSIWSPYFHTDGATAFLAGWPMGGAVLLFPEGEPILFSPGGSREHFFAAMQIWCEMRSIPHGLATELAGTIAGEVGAGGRIGIVGAEHIDADSYRALADGLAAFELVDFSAEYRAVTAVKRPREVLALRHSTGIARLSVEAGQAAFDAGADNMSALAEAERVARLAGARDFRGLVNGAGQTLRPFDGQSGGRHAPLRLWVAIDQHGYWGTAANADAAPAESPAAQALAAMIAALAPGAVSGDVAVKGLSVMPAEAWAMALSCGLGGGIGLNLDEMPRIEPESETVLTEGMILSLQAYVVADVPSFATATMRVTATGAEWLTPP